MAAGTRTRGAGSAPGRWSIGHLLLHTKRSLLFGSPSGIPNGPNEVRRLLVRSGRHAAMAAVAALMGLVLAAAASAAETEVQLVLEQDPAQVA